MNDIVEGHLGNQGNVAIYQNTFGDQAEAACQNDHRNDVRSVFAWAFRSAAPPVATPAPATPSLQPKAWLYKQHANGGAAASMLSEAQGTPARAILSIDCFATLSPPTVGVSVSWLEPSHIAGFPTGQPAWIDIAYQFHHEHKPTRGWWKGEQLDHYAFALLPLDGNPLGFVVRLLEAPALAVVLVESRNGTDFYFESQHAHSIHPVRKVLKACGY